MPGQIGLEPTPAAFVARMVEVFAEVRRVLRPDGTLWLNLGDSYCNAGSRNNGTGLDGKRRGGVTDTAGTWQTAKGTYGDIRHTLKADGIKHKDLVGIPWRVAFALQDVGWWLRSDIIWHKPSPMPESVTDRPTRAHEYVFLLTKAARYFFDAEAVREPHSEASVSRAQYGGRVHPRGWHTEAVPISGGDNELEGLNAGGRNVRTVWLIPPANYSEAHFATFPPALPERCILAGTSAKGCCPACGAPWVRVVEKERKATRPGDGSKVHGRNSRANVSRDPAHRHEWEGKAGLAVGNRDPQRHTTATRSVGWRQGCDCPEAEPVPCTTLDPFAGAATTGLVSLRHGRRFIGLELNPAYCEMARRRLVEDAPMFNVGAVVATPLEPGLFDALPDPTPEETP